MFLLQAIHYWLLLEQKNLTTKDKQMMINKGKFFSEANWAEGKVI